ncbi:hypothetical protein [Treponema sp. R6D11]
MSDRTVPLRALEKERAKFKQRLADPELVRGQKILGKLKEMFQMESQEVETLIEENKLSVANEATEAVKPDNQNDFLTEFAELIKNPVYSDAGNYIEEIKTYASDNSCNLKTAYNALFAEKKYAEIKKDAEAMAFADYLTRKSEDVPASLSGGGAAAKDERTKLDTEHIKAAEKYGMSTEEYLKFM